MVTKSWNASTIRREQQHVAPEAWVSKRRLRTLPGMHFVIASEHQKAQVIHHTKVIRTVSLWRDFKRRLDTNLLTKYWCPDDKINVVYISTLLNEQIMDQLNVACNEDRQLNLLTT